MLPLDHCNLQRYVGVNNLPKAVARQCGGRDSNSSSCKSIALTTRPPGQPLSGTSAYHQLTRSVKTCAMTPVCNLRRCKISCRAEGRRWCEGKSRQHRQASCSVAARTSPTHQSTRLSHSTSSTSNTNKSRLALSKSILLLISQGIPWRKWAPHLRQAGRGLHVVDTHYAGKWAWLAGRGRCMASRPEWKAGRNGSVHLVLNYTLWAIKTEPLIFVFNFVKINEI